MIKYGSDVSSNSVAMVGGKIEASKLFDGISGIAKYATSNKSIAKVNKKGIITAKKSGTVIIYALTSDKQTISSAEIIVEKPEMEKKASIALGVSANAMDYLSGVTYSPTQWISSKPAVATVDEDGNIKALKKGKTKIIAVFGSGKNSTKKKYKTKLIVEYG